jgi:hypothetical protein
LPAMAHRYMAMPNMQEAHQLSPRSEPSGVPHAERLIARGGGASRLTRGPVYSPRTHHPRDRDRLDQVLDVPECCQARNLPTFSKSVRNPSLPATSPMGLPHPASMPLTSARQLSGPTIPSTLKPSACWKPRTASSVCGPKIPSICTPWLGSPERLRNWNSPARPGPPHPGRRSALARSVSARSEARRLHLRSARSLSAPPLRPLP